MHGDQSDYLPTFVVVVVIVVVVDTSIEPIGWFDYDYDNDNDQPCEPGVNQAKIRETVVDSLARPAD